MLLECLEAQAFHVVSQNDTNSISKLTQGSFCKNCNEEASEKDLLDAI